MFRCPAAVFPGKPPDQEQQPEQEQKGVAKLPKNINFCRGFRRDVRHSLDQEQQPEQEQKGAAKLRKISIFVGDSEGTLGTLWTLFWAFPVLHCPCVSLSGSRFSREAAGSGAAAGAGAKRSCKVAKNINFCRGFRRDVRHSLDQEQQPEQEQKGAAKLRKISIFVGDSEGTLGTLWTLFWAFPVLHCPCASLSGSRFPGKPPDQEQQRSKKELQSCQTYQFL